MGRKCIMNEALFQEEVSRDEHRALGAMFDDNVDLGVTIGTDDIVHALEIAEMA